MSNPTLIGVDLGGTNVRAGRIEDGELAEQFGQPITSKAPQEIILDEVRGSIACLMTPEVSAIGVGVPSLVDTHTGIVYSVENIPSWREVHLKEFLQEHFQLPVHINNDANCFALGEYQFGAGRGVQNMVGLIAGTGMAAGIIANGKLFSGQNCGAGEIGAIPHHGHTIEYFCSGQFFTREFGQDGATLHQLAKQNDPRALEAFTQFGAHFAHAIQTILYAYDPELIILGGSVSKAFPHFEKSMRENLKSFTFPHILPRLKILPTTTHNIALLGAAALCLNNKI